MNSFWKEFFKWLASAVIVGAVVWFAIWILTLLKAFLMFIGIVALVAASAYAIYFVKKFIDKYLAKQAVATPVDNTKKV